MNLSQERGRRYRSVIDKGVTLLLRIVGSRRVTCG